MSEISISKNPRNGDVTIRRYPHETTFTRKEWEEIVEFVGAYRK